MKTLIIVGMLALLAFAVVPSAEAAPTCQNVPGVVTACVELTVTPGCTQGGSCDVSYSAVVTSP